MSTTKSKYKRVKKIKKDSCGKCGNFFRECFCPLPRVLDISKAWNNLMKMFKGKKKKRK